MSAKLLLPGFGGKYTSESFTGTATGADTIDASRCAQIGLQITGTGATGDILLHQSFADGKWAPLTSMTVTDADAFPLSMTAGPFGLLRLSAEVTAGTCTVTIVGYPNQVVN